MRHEVELKTLVSKIPEFLEANLDGLEIGDSIHISSINLKDGVEPTIKDRDFTIATIAPPTVMKVEEEKPVSEEESQTDLKNLLMKRIKKRNQKIKQTVLIKMMLKRKKLKIFITVNDSSCWVR